MFDWLNKILDKKYKPCGTEIRKIRQQYNVSQRQFADLISVAQQTISDAEQRDCYYRTNTKMVRAFQHEFGINLLNK